MPHEIKAEHFQLLVNIIRNINSPMALNELLDYIIESASTVVQSEESSLMLVDEGNQKLIFHIATGRSETVLKEIAIPIDQGIAGYVVKTGEPIIIDDPANDERWFSKVDDETKMVTRNLMAVPMKTNDKIVGVLEVINSKDRKKFNKYDLFLLHYLSDQAAIAITNRELFDKYQEKVAELSALYELSQASHFSRDFEEMFDNVVPIIAKTLYVEKCIIAIKLKKEFVIKATYGVDENLKNKVLPNKIEDTPEKSLFPENQLNILSGGYIAVPMFVKDDIIGVICISKRKNEHPISSSELRLLSTISNQLVESYENIRLYMEEQERKRIQKELEVMRKLQQSILPKNFHLSPKIDISGLSEPAQEVGGDFYDFFPLDDNRIAIVMADVSGKGLPSALFMALCRSVIKAHAFIKDEPKDVMDLSNKMIVGDSEAGMFVTVFYTVIDTQKYQINFSNAGHLPQILFKYKEKKIKWIDSNGKPLGVFDSAKYYFETEDVEKDDFLLLFTDGIIEAINKEFEEFGEERLIDIINNNYDKNPDELIELILDNIKKFTEGTNQFDDITLLAIKFK